MVDFKKRALILSLAATISVTGSFAANNYKNCLMNMEFMPINNNEIHLVLSTRTPYDAVVSPVKKDATTYVIMLPETDSQAPTPNLTNAGNCIKSVDIRKMPYSGGAKGYTRILIKTTGAVSLNTSTEVYLPAAETPKRITATSSKEDSLREIREARAERLRKKQQREADNEKPDAKNNPSSQKADNKTHKTDMARRPASETGDTDTNSVEVSSDSDFNEDIPDETSHQKYLLGLLVVFILMACAYMYIKAQGNMNNVLGEKLEIDIGDDSKENTGKTRKNHRISSTINKLDSKYSNNIPFKMNEYTTENSPSVEIAADTNVVDLDALFKEKQMSDNTQPEQDMSDALDDFLSGFSFDDEGVVQSVQDSDDNTIGYDEEAYLRLISKQDIVFSKKDIDCFQELLLSELSDDLLKNIKDYAVPVEKEPKKKSLEKILEKFIMDYTVFQHITFDADNINTLKKLISVELDRDFVHNLRTDPKRTIMMEEEILSSKHESSLPEEKMLNVKSMLPNLEDALKKQGNKPIESEVKPDVVYYKEGYDVSKLSLDVELPDLSKEVKSYRVELATPSATIETVDQSYSDSVDKISISGLPDLKDVMANPEKYKDEEPEEFVPDEETLLNRIMNVQFKPFDDGTRSFEIINDIDEEEENTELPVVDIQKEFSQFSNFEVAENEESEKVYAEQDYDDFEALYNQNFVDLDANRNKNEENNSEINNNPPLENEQKDIVEQKQELQKEPKQPPKQESKPKQEPQKEEFVPKNLNRVQNINQKVRTEKSEKLSEMLEKIRSERQEKLKEVRKSQLKPAPEKVAKSESQKIPAVVKCIYEGVNYDILSSAAIMEDIGCHLAKANNEYAVFAYKGTELSIIKKYDSLNNEKIFARLSDTLSDGTPRYIIRVGSNKFIIDIKDGQVRYVMDL